MSLRHPLILVSMLLEAETETQGNTIAETAGMAEDIPLGTEVERNLEGNAEFVFKTNLGIKTDTEVVAIIFARVETSIGTDTSIPAETAADVEIPLVDTCEVDVGTPVFVVVPTQVEFKAIG